MAKLELKKNLFSEKIAAVRIAQKGTDSILHTLNNIDYLPTTISLYSEIDFFNIKGNTDYLIHISLLSEENGDIQNFPVHAARVNIPSDQLILPKDNIGKAQGNLEFGIVTESENDYLLLFTFYSQNGEMLDSYYQYLSIKQG